MKDILAQYGFDERDCAITVFGNGLINHTWLLEAGGEKYILQKINDAIFKSPEDIAFNISLVADYLKKIHPDYLFVAPLKTLSGQDMTEMPEGYFRIFPFIKGTHSIDVVEDPLQAYEAARQFARFTKLLAGVDTQQLKMSLPDFHNLPLRYRQFEDALMRGNKERIRQSENLVTYLKVQKGIVEIFESSSKHFKIRCTHHDTKISNVLFDDTSHAVCVIDLDTLMPGYFISDVGDMMRTYLSPVSEEEKDFSKIVIRKDFYRAIREGYLAEMGDELTEAEKNAFGYAGKFMIYMQALRFLTDHINNDIYYGAKYDGHNFVRAGNQAVLLQRLTEFYSEEGSQ